MTNRREMDVCTSRKNDFHLRKILSGLPILVQIENIRYFVTRSSCSRRTRSSNKWNDDALFTKTSEIPAAAHAFNCNCWICVCLVDALKRFSLVQQKFCVFTFACFGVYGGLFACQFLHELILLLLIPCWYRRIHIGTSHFFSAQSNTHGIFAHTYKTNGTHTHTHTRNVILFILCFCLQFIHLLGSLCFGRIYSQHPLRICNDTFASQNDGN